MNTELLDALDRMDGLLDPQRKLLAVGDNSATAVASRADMAMIRSALSDSCQPKLPQTEGFDWFLVVDPKTGVVEHAYSAELGRDFGQEHIKQAQEDEIDGAARWVVRPAYAEAPKALTLAVRDVLAERARQVSAKGYDPEHDEMYEGGELAAAAATYALLATGAEAWRVDDHWPWSMHSLKKGDPRRMLEKAGALILAELERLDSAAQPVAPDLDAWKCEKCHGTGIHEFAGFGDSPRGQYPITQREDCDQCETVGWCGPDAKAAARAAPGGAQ